MEKVTIDGHNNLARDINTMAVINTNNEAKKQVLATRQQKIEQKETLARHDRDINSIKQSVNEISAILTKILNNLDKACNINK